MENYPTLSIIDHSDNSCILNIGMDMIENHNLDIQSIHRIDLESEIQLIIPLIETTQFFEGTTIYPINVNDIPGNTWITVIIKFDINDEQAIAASSIYIADPVENRKHKPRSIGPNRRSKKAISSNKRRKINSIRQTKEIINISKGNNK